jgi:hypothetical protein
MISWHIKRKREGKESRKGAASRSEETQTLLSTNQK